MKLFLEVGGMNGVKAEDVNGETSESEGSRQEIRIKNRKELANNLKSPTLVIVITRLFS